MKSREFLKKCFRKVLKTPKNIFLACAATLLTILLLFNMYRAFIEPDSQCFRLHTPTSQPPDQLKSANDFFLQGDYEYEKGKCTEAVEYYSKAIELDSNFTEAYNNRGYTYMRMREYEAALHDLNQAITLRPNYINALMNRGDIYNYYYSIDREKALADYDRVIDAGAPKQGNLCVHRLLALNDGWSFKVVWLLITEGGQVGCK
jgi:tetratricopeptide (TPR) repeat protein